MMNECKIVQDLLPLYAEDLVSVETKEYVDCHCKGCDACEKLRLRAMEPIPEAPVDPKAYQKMLRRDSFRMIGRGVGIVMLISLTFILLVGGGAAYVAWEYGTFPVERSYESKVTHEEYGDFTWKIDIADWDNAGFFETGAGSVVTRRQTSRSKDGGSHSSIGVSYRNWENIQIYWAPNGMDYLLAADIVGGNRGYFIWDQEFEEYRQGRASVGGSWYPAGSEKGITEQLLSRCQDEADFPKGWNNITFAFHQWGGDSETITFIYETDNGHRGLLDYHYPSETITDFT